MVKVILETWEAILWELAIQAVQFAFALDQALCSVQQMMQLLSCRASQNRQKVLSLSIPWPACNAEQSTDFQGKAMFHL